MIYRGDVKIGDLRRYVYLVAKGHAEALKQTREQLVAQFGYADSEFEIQDVVSEDQKPHILLGEIRNGTKVIGYDYEPIFLTAQPLFQRDKLNNTGRWSSGTMMNQGFAE